MTTRIKLNAARLKEMELEKKLQLSTSELGLPIRTTNCFDELGVTTIRELLECSPEKLLSVPNFGGKTLEEVYKALEKLGFYRKGREPKTE
ncbi:MAG: hypothetical protein FWC43_10480 [Planctomycetaceae bacterium]|nr:hypothetical protein [Planctomycetaceae bacterium]